MSSPSVTCIVPAYNAARFIGETIDSVLAQTFPVAEIIVVDDGSMDTTSAVVEGYSDTVRLIRQPNTGPAAARNNGIRNSSGDFIAFIDSDDLWTPDKLEIQMARFTERPELQVCFTHLINFRNLPGSILFRDGYEETDEWPLVHFIPSSMVARRNAFGVVGGFSEELRRAEDTEWYARMMMRGITYEVVETVLLYRRVHDRNLTMESPPGPEDVVRVLKIALDKRRAEGW